MVGRPKPSELHTLHGNPGKRRRAEPPKAEPLPGLPEPPDFLSAEAQAEWRLVVQNLAALRLLTQVDLGLLAGWCSAVGDFVSAERALRQDGLITVDRDGRERRSPMLMIRNKALELMRSLAVEFGFSPRARAGIATPPVAPLGGANPPRTTGMPSLAEFLAEGDGDQ